LNEIFKARDTGRRVNVAKLLHQDLHYT